MGILLDFLYLALIVLCIGLGYLVLMWALGLFGIVIPARWLQVIAAIIMVLVLIWFVSQIAGGGGVHFPQLR